MRAESLIGEHPRILARMYGGGRPADLHDLGDAPRTRVLAVGLSPEVRMLARPLVRMFACVGAWQIDKRFDLETNRGHDVILGRTWYRFRLRLAPSTFDGRDTMVLSYADPADRNLWPVPSMYDELRTVGDGLAVGATLVRGWRRPVFWFAMERTPTLKTAAR